MVYLLIKGSTRDGLDFADFFSLNSMLCLIMFIEYEKKIKNGGSSEKRALGTV